MDWRALEARVDGVMAASWGEQVRLAFMKGEALDASRPAIELRAILHVAGDRVASSGPADTYKTLQALGDSELILNRDTYTGPAPKQGDKVRALERAGQPWFRVANVSDRYSNLIVLHLGEV